VSDERLDEDLLDDEAWEHALAMAYRAAGDPALRADRAARIERQAASDEREARLVALLRKFARRVYSDGSCCWCGLPPIRSDAVHGALCSAAREAHAALEVIGGEPSREATP
jgi:hypothetical protein